MKNIIFIAPPAAGKGTVSDALISEYGYVHISTGDMLRAEIATGSDFGKEIDALISKGIFVPDELVTELLKNTLASLDKPFILDGYPRNLLQADILNELLSDLNIDNYVAIYLDIEKDEARKRATGRLICEKCNISYHKYNESTKPKQDGICDRCGEKLVQRADDSEETFNKRYDTFINVTYPLHDYYKKLDKLEVIDSNKGSGYTLEQAKEIIIEA